MGRSLFSLADLEDKLNHTKELLWSLLQDYEDLPYSKVIARKALEKKIHQTKARFDSYIYQLENFGIPLSIFKVSVEIIIYKKIETVKIPQIIKKTGYFTDCNRDELLRYIKILYSGKELKTIKIKELRKGIKP